MFDLTDKCALVTGASGGIGSAIAKAFATQGAKVVLSGTRQDALEAVAAEIEAFAPGKAIVIAANLSDPKDIERLVNEAEAAMGRVDILVNNAGLTKDGLAMRMSDDDWQAVIDVNLSAAFRLSRAVMRGMMKRRFGRIIGITSVSAAIGNPGQANYCASKAGMIGMSKSLAYELAGRNITVNCVAPGLIQTAMSDAMTEPQRQRMLSAIPVGRLGTSEEIASAAVFLAANEASYVTGQTIHVNGGMAMI